MLGDNSENRPIISLLAFHYFRHMLSTNLSVSRYHRRHLSFHHFTSWQATGKERRREHRKGLWPTSAIRKLRRIQ
jgi:hypothetical protein